MTPDKNGSLNSDKEDKEARKERKRLKRESKEKRREERRKKKLLKNQEILFKMVEGLLIDPIYFPPDFQLDLHFSSRPAHHRRGRRLLCGQDCSQAYQDQVETHPETGRFVRETLRLRHSQQRRREW